MRALLLALLFTTACTTDEKEAAKHDPAPPAASTAHREADDKATEDEQARKAAIADVAGAQATVEATAAKAHVETGAQLQKNFDAADRRLNTLGEKAASATGAAKNRAKAPMADARAREASVMASIAKLRDANGAAWDTAKAQVDSDLVALNHAIDSLERVLQGSN